MKERHITTGKVFYDTGELYFEGTYCDDGWDYLRPWEPITLIEGIMYYKNGNKYREGRFQLGGLLEGKEYYESGALKFDGIFNDKHHSRGSSANGMTKEDDQNSQNMDLTIAGGCYYGPSYPVEGKFYSEDGSLIYEGKFEVVHQGGVGYPKVVFPAGYGSL